MPRDGESETLDERVRSELVSVLSRHPVSFALLFGSAARDSMGTDSDVDVAVEFQDLRPSDETYNRVYLQLVTDMAAALDVDVDIVDVHTMSPRFAATVFESDEILVGTEDRRIELKAELATEAASFDDALDRVRTSANRLRARE